MKYYSFICLLLLLGGCTGGGGASDDAENREHVWSDQVNTIKKAEDVETILDEAGALQRQQIDEQAQ